MSLNNTNQTKPIEIVILDDDGDLKACQWESMLNHIQGIHEHDNDLYPACPHGDIEREWMNPGKNRSLLCL